MYIIKLTIEINSIRQSIKAKDAIANVLMDYESDTDDYTNDHELKVTVRVTSNHNEIVNKLLLSLHELNLSVFYTIAEANDYNHSLN